MTYKTLPFNFTDMRIISDSIAFLHQCKADGFTTQALNQIESLPEQSLIFSFCNEAARRTFEIAKLTPAKQSIFLCGACVRGLGTERALRSRLNT